MKPAIFKSFVSSMVIMWDDNFKQALYDGIDPSDGYSPSDASEALQKYFKEIMAGTKPSPSLAELDDRSASVYTHIPLHSIMP